MVKSLKLLLAGVCFTLSGCLANTIGYQNATGPNTARVQFFNLPEAQHTLVNVYTDAHACTGTRRLAVNERMITVPADRPLAFTLQYVIKLKLGDPEVITCTQTVTFTPTKQDYRVAGAILNDACGLRVERRQAAQWFAVADVKKRVPLQPFLESQPRCEADAQFR